jgi:MraZ protein
MGFFGGQAMLLTGSYRRALDDKQRLAIPKPFREQLSAGTRLFLTQGFDGCLAAYPEPEFAALAERLAASSPAAREVRTYSRLFYAQATSVVPDRLFRFRLPAELARWASLAGEVMIVGVRDHFEIWAADKWEQFVSQSDSQFDALAEMAFNAAPSAADVAAPAPRVPTQPR